MERFDIVGKQLLKVNNKFYMVDMGIRNHILPRKRYDLGVTIENIVYLELSRRGGKVNIGKYGSTEVDFVTQKEGVLTYYQVTVDMTAEETFEREMRPLRSIHDNYEKDCPDTGSFFTRKLRRHKSCECHRLAFGMRNLHLGLYTPNQGVQNTLVRYSIRPEQPQRKRKFLKKNLALQ